MKLRLILTTVCLTAALSGCFEKKADEAAPLPEQPSKVLDYLALSASSLVDLQQPDGFFKYEYDFITGTFTPWDNVIHQARTGFALMSYYSFLVNAGILPQNANIVLHSVRNALTGYQSASIRHNSMPGMLISFYYNKSGAGKNGAQDKTQRLEAEIAATAFALSAETLYRSATNSDEFSVVRSEWRNALLYHAKQALQMPLTKRPFMAPVWLALGLYHRADPNDTEIETVLMQTDDYFMKAPRPITKAESYVWDMLSLRTHTPADFMPVTYTVRQTMQILNDLYAQHDPNANGCLLSLGLAEASLILNNIESPDIKRIRQTALGRGQLEYYNSLKFTILPNQTWISLGPGRTLHSQDFKRFAGASVFGTHSPRTNIGLTSLCLLAGMRFANEDLLEMRKLEKVE